MKSSIRTMNNEKNRKNKAFIKIIAYNFTKNEKGDDQANMLALSALSSCFRVGDLSPEDAELELRRLHA